MAVISNATSMFKLTQVPEPTCYANILRHQPILLHNEMWPNYL